MNYLAHIYLAGDNHKSMIGNLLGDFVKKHEDNKFEDSVRQGIFMHRKIDSFTDSHLIFLNSRRRISSSNRRFAGFLIDMFYDHFLAKNWSEYSPVPLEEYSAKFYNILENNAEHLPDKLLKIMPIMIEENWLLSYREIIGIERAVIRVGRRFGILEDSSPSFIEELTSNYENLEHDFNAFFPEVMIYAKQIRLTMENGAVERKLTTN